MTQPLVNGIRRLLSRARYTAAVRACKAASAKSFQSDPEFHILEGAALFMTGEYDEAANAFKIALRLQPDNVDAHIWLGLINSWGYDEGYPKGVEYYRSAISLDPKNVDGYVGLAIMLGNPRPEMDANPKEAIELLEKAVELDPDNLDVHNNLGYIYWEQGLFAAAKEQFEAIMIRDNRVRSQSWFIEAMSRLERGLLSPAVGSTAPAEYSGAQGSVFAATGKAASRAGLHTCPSSSDMEIRTTM